jgi:putative membrane protein
MTRFVVNWLAIVIAVYIAAAVLPTSMIAYSSYGGLAAFGLVLGLLNAFVGPILKILTFPLTLLTLGFFSLVVNALLFWFAASISGSILGLGTVTVSGFLAALVAAVIVSVVSLIVRRVL